MVIHYRPHGTNPLRLIRSLPVMSLFTANGNGGGTVLYTNPTTRHLSTQHPRRPLLLPLSPRRALHLVPAAKKLSSSFRTGRFDSKNRRKSIATKEEEEEEEEETEFERESGADVDASLEGYVRPKLEGDEPDFWEGEQWEALGFFVQYMWAFGVLFALIACGIAVATYNEGATDFKQTPAYKESIQSQELLEEPDASNSDVFESNPTEVAPSLE